MFNDRGGSFSFGGEYSNLLGYPSTAALFRFGSAEDGFGFRAANCMCKKFITLNRDRCWASRRDSELNSWIPMLPSLNAIHSSDEEGV